MKAIGIDLTNAICRNSLVPKGNWLPNVILPLISDEPALAGASSNSHRRGSGLMWPPECQIPYGHDPKFGKGRVSVAEAWRYLAPFKTQDKAWDNYHPHQYQIHWQPDPSSKGSIVKFSAEDIVYEALRGSCFSFEGVEQICLVVPDDLGEGAQQALLDRCRGLPKIHLLPRPVAIATYWCSQQDPSQFKVMEQATGKCGHICVLATGLDRWEFCPIDIWKLGDTLIPVRDHTVHSSGLPVDGLSMLAAYVIATRMTTPECVWFDLMFGNLTTEQEYLSCNCSEAAYLSSCERLESWEGCLSLDASERLTKQSSITSKIRHAKQKFHPDFHETLFSWNNDKCLAVVADGATAHLRVDNISIAENSLRSLGVPVEVSNGSATFHGAEMVAMQLHEGLTTYRDRIAPVRIYYQCRDKFNDPIISTKTLIEGKTVVAGRTAKTPVPIKEFSIPAGQKELELVLAREFGAKKEIREVSARVREKLKTQEPVEITAEIRPGQGFASANVVSVKPGLFETKLNWQKMVECDEPKPPKYAWPPGVANIHSTVSVNELASFRHMRDLLADYEPGNGMSNSIRDFREEIRPWILRDDDAKSFEYDGKIPSSDSYSRFVDSELLQELSANLGDAISLAPGENKLIRLAGWLYQACPEEAINLVSERIKSTSAETQPCDLEVAGKAFVECTEVGIFVNGFIKRIRQLSGDYSLDNNYHWIRAFRDMIRFRGNTLRRDYIDDRCMNIIEKYIIGLMWYDSDCRGPKYSSCMYIAPHILKRRRFDDRFLAVDSKRWSEWERVLKFASNNGKEQQRKMANVTMNFLNKEATDEDVILLAQNETYK